MTYVIDACALIAYLRDEAGADVVEQLLVGDDATLIVHSVNLCEVYYDCVRAEGQDQAENLVDALVAAGLVVRDDMDVDFWKAAGRLKAGGRISLADAFAVSLATREAATLLTSDHHEFDPLMAKGDLPVQIRFIR
jgi:predicted nucleic acid-binding protein